MAKVGEAVSNLSLLSSYEVRLSLRCGSARRDLVDGLNCSSAQAFSARNTRSSFVSVASTMSDLVSVASDESDAQCRTEGARAPADTDRNADEGGSREAALLPSDAKVIVPEIPAQLVSLRTCLCLLLVPCSPAGLCRACPR